MSIQRRRRAAVPVVALATVTLAVSAAVPAASAVASSARRTHHSAPTSLIPKPVLQSARSGTFELTRRTRILAGGRAAAIAHDLARDLRPATGYRLPIAHGNAHRHDITLQLAPGAAVPGDKFDEGYRVQVRKTGVTLRAASTHGLFNGVQTLVQLLPPWIASPTRQPGPWPIRGTHIVDYPHFGYRGFMLDIGRHYEPPSVVERLINEAARYKFNVFHLHLSDDQGFRVKINGFPRLTRIGARGSVGTQGRTRDPGGFWTKAQYRSVVSYAAARFMTVIPEVDSPGHNNAIIMSEYKDTKNPRLNGHPRNINCSTNHPPKWNYTGDVGYSAMCPGSANTWAIMRAIIGQLAKMSPGGYYDIGGDEVPASTLSHQRYAKFVNKEAGIVSSAKKTLMGWADVSSKGTKVPAGSIAEYWNPARGSASGTESGTQAVAKHMKIVMAPANHAYLDQRYAKDVPSDLGQTWACPHGCDVDQFYNWTPAHYVKGVTAKDVIGVEGALWTETIRNRAAAEYMTFPRLLALAEIGWSPRVRRTANSPAYRDFLHRLAAQAPRLQAAGENFYVSPEVPWHLTLAAHPVHRNAHAVHGMLATLSAPGVPTASLDVSVRWQPGHWTAATVSGTDPGTDRTNGLYRISGSHTYSGHGPAAVTVRVHAPGMGTTRVRVPLR